MSTTEEKWKKVRSQPLVPLFAVLTSVVLLGGLGNFAVGGSPLRSQYFMRARVMAQGACVVAIGGYYLINKWETEQKLALANAAKTSAPAKAT